ncbi:MAG: 5-oxoprolinase subunit PxpB [Deltaproteobacteria bacterium]|nr:5-oxoprolinase subunit PxpB [Deltaproteobacteria bacterium]MBW2562953.1 5-oxoprolinase subunit PxpB [Deltaproteobacteria bacterium]
MQNGLFKKPLFRIAGDRGLLVEYGDVIDPDVNNKVRSMAIIMEKESSKSVIETIPTYRSLLIIYDPAITNPTKLEKEILALEERLSQIKIPPPDTVEIPVCYGGEFGPDIQFVADHNSITKDDVIRIHSEADYQIYMIGFTPGFPFLGGLPKELHTPRLETPRSFVPERSVGIANNQTGIYPLASPGGWQLIGKTPLKLFAPEHSNPFIYKVGDRIKFKPISTEDYYRLAGEVKK